MASWKEFTKDRYYAKLVDYSMIAFEEPLDDRFRCTVCKNALNDPQQTECGHRMCQKCLQQIFRGNSPKCPVDGEVLTQDGVFRDVCCRREILCLFVYCPNRENGCEWKKELQYLEKHLVNCEYNGVPCENPGCNEQVPKKMLKEHQENCPYKPSDCQYCLQVIPSANMENHFLDCSKFPVTCPGCNEENIPRDELVDHQTEFCDQAVILCKFGKHGCNFKGTREALEQHNIDRKEEHLNLIADALRQSEHMHKEMSKHMNQMGEENKKLQHQVSEQREALAVSTQNLRAYQGKLNLVERSVGEHRREIAEMRQRIQGTSCQATDTDQIALQLQEIGTAFREQERRLATIEHEASRGGSPSFGPRSMGAPSMVAIDRRQDRNEHQLALHDIQMAEHDLKLQMLEATSYDGNYIWKIDEYSRRFQEGLTGKTPSIYSPPFYVGRYGYKVCARVYPNGDGMGKGSHLSLFFVIMKGEYDALVSWPFRQKVTFKLLDQDRQQDIGDTFRPDPSSSSFKRPTTNMNIASGCPLFISHQSLQSHAYIKDDTMFIKITVETTGMSSV